MQTHVIPWNSPIHRREDLAAQDLDGDIVMADIESGQFYGLGESAKRIWELLAEPRTPESICTELVQEYDVDRAVCEADVREFLLELNRTGLIRVEE